MPKWGVGWGGGQSGTFKSEVQLESLKGQVQMALFSLTFSTRSAQDVSE